MHKVYLREESAIYGKHVVYSPHSPAGMFLWALACSSSQYVKEREEGFWKLSVHSRPLSHLGCENLLMVVFCASPFYLLGLEQYF